MKAQRSDSLWLLSSDQESGGGGAPAGWPVPNGMKAPVGLSRPRSRPKGGMSVREAPTWRKAVPRSLASQGSFLFLLRSQRDPGLHFLCREKVTKSGRGARAEGLLRKARPFGAGRPSRGDQSPHVPPCPPGGNQFAQRSGANCEPAGATPPPVNLWPLSFDQESGDPGVGLLPDKFSNHKYFPWHKVKQARTSAPTGVS